MVLMAAACQRDASAQQAASNPLGPVQCFQAVTAIGGTFSLVGLVIPILRIVANLRRRRD